MYMAGSSRLGTDLFSIKAHPGRTPGIIRDLQIKLGIVG